jgi:hypothetical protein
MKPVSHDGHPLKFINLKFEVDELIYPLLVELWKRNFNTQYSCQGGITTEKCFDTEITRTKNAYILFYGDVSAKWFAKLIENAGYDCEYSPRQYDCGGGASVHFSHELISIFTELVSSSGDYKDYYFQQEVRSAVGYLPKNILRHNEKCPTFESRLYLC